jgi:2'-5' RNA ligase
VVTSVNVPVPGRVERLADDLRPALSAFDRVRDRHTLLCKRLPEAEPTRLTKRVRVALERTPAFEARVTGVDFFAEPARGPGPVVYLAVESPGLRETHERLCATFPPVEGVEGAAYTPHVTLARGGSVADAERLREREVDPVTWTVSALELYDADHREPTARVPLPA